MPLDADIAANLDDLRRRLRAAASRTGRPESSVRLIAVTKTFGPEHVRAAMAAGQREFGENRVQEGLDKIAAVADSALAWHLIGHLQTNKARKAAAAFAWIHSIDSVELLRKVDAGAVDAGTTPQVLVQVDLAQETTKFGAERGVVTDIVRAALEARAVQLRGLMIVPPIPEQAEASRPWFRQLRELREALVTDGIPAAHLSELSMGMSQDFDVAIEEGATMVRIGTSIFGRRPRAGA